MQKPQEEEDFIHSDDDSQEFENLRTYIQKELKSKPSSASKQPKVVSTMIGEANKLYLERRFEEAVSICKEAIKIFPENPEPFHLLSVPKTCFIFS